MQLVLSWGLEWVIWGYVGRVVCQMWMLGFVLVVFILAGLERFALIRGFYMLGVMRGASNSSYAAVSIAVTCSS